MQTPMMTCTVCTHCLSSGGVWTKTNNQNKQPKQTTLVFLFCFLDHPAPQGYFTTVRIVTVQVSVLALENTATNLITAGCNRPPIFRKVQKLYGYKDAPIFQVADSRLTVSHLTRDHKRNRGAWILYIRLKKIKFHSTYRSSRLL